MKNRFPLYREGFVVDYLVADPAIEDFKAPYALSDQLEFERQMREIYYVEPKGYPTTPKLGEQSPIGTAWRYYTDNKNPYVDFSKFYFTLTRVEFLAATTLVSDKKRNVRAKVWSYAAFDMWCGEKRVACEKVPVYQPIRSTEINLSLDEGENPIFFAVQNFGVRDTRNMIALQILDCEGISVTLPIEDGTLAALNSARNFFFDLKVRGNKLLLPYAPDFEVNVDVDGAKKPLAAGVTELDVGEAKKIDVSAKLFGQSFLRRILPLANNYPPHSKRENPDPFLNNSIAVVEKSGYLNYPSGTYAKEVTDHGGSDTVFNYIAANGFKLDERSLADLITITKDVRRRSDCTDFTLLLLLTLRRIMPLPEELLIELRESALDFRYWMDEDGADAMCFWSENHALTFYCCQLMAGEDYPDELFHRSGRTGREQRAVAIRRINEWFDVIEAEGFEEFLAGGYMGITIEALAAVYAYGTEDQKPRAKATLDRIVRESAAQCFDGIHLAPMGRIYRGVLSPYVSAVQALLYIIDERNAVYHYGRLTTFGLTDYKFPENLEELMRGDLDLCFDSGRAEIHTRKRKNYMLTSVASPRLTPIPEIKDTETEYFKTKIMNEGFHGTSLFTPGGRGYQQHLWYAALSERFYVFVNNPGTERDFCGMRPGYWYGNLVFPRVVQEGRELWCSYEIPDDVPTKFTHAYFPAYAADEVVMRDGFRFARVKDGYLALYCSVELEAWENDATPEADLRAFGTRSDWYVRTGSADEDGSFEKFIEETLTKKTVL